jgi:DNA-binding transcriptional ArsR family regulator
MTDLCTEINKLGKGIGNTARYRILEALQKSPRTVGELVKKVRLSQPAVSQHLRTLKECDLVCDEKQGQEVIYSLNTEHMLTLLGKLSDNIQKERKSKK